MLAVRALLRERLGILGHLEEQPLQQGAKEKINLILRLPGRCPQLPPLLVGAHYDGPPQSPGANNNASGVAALLELARCWHAAPPVVRCGWWPLIRRKRACSAAGHWPSGSVPTGNRSI